MSAAPTPAWLDALRRDARARADATGLPTRRDEAWKYTDFALSGAAAYPLAARWQDAVPASLATRPVAGGVPLVLVNGTVVGDWGAPDGVTIGRLDSPDARSLVEAHLGAVIPAARKSLAALNGGLFTDGLVLRITAGTRLERPIEVLSLGASDAASGPLSFHPRLLVVVEEGGFATLVESHRGTGAYFSNSVVEVALAEGAGLDHYKIQDESLEGVHVATLGVSVAARAVYRGALLQAGSRLARHEVHASLCGRDAVFELDGAYLGVENQHLDNTTFVTHAAPGGQSRQLFKGVLDNQAQGVFQGTVLVERAAQKTNAHQLSKALLLSAGAGMSGKPELEIYADDVKCGHGCTVGDIDETALFYLRSRGIAEADARQLLIEAFLADVLEHVSLDPVRETFTAVVSERLRRARLGKEDR
ncbi:MAG: Fe-S cluster assembly protein SufD [Telmatospirillum sp.]|nr:Fe-S cluster assembly protein SufD [Telmatospirillum sp.]